MNSFEQRKHNDVLGLEWINKFGWLRTAELGRLMWPNDDHARTRTDRVTRSWLERQLVIARPLPDGAGRGLVLSEAGARVLREAGIAAISGKDIGETAGKTWIAPKNWQHDLMAAGVLTILYERGHDIQSERQIRQLCPSLNKIPDGLAWLPEHPDSAVWLEVENARKDGKPKYDLAKMLIVVSNGQCPSLSGITPIHSMVAFIPTAKDERKYALDHRTRLTKGIQSLAREDVTVVWASCTMLGCGVSRVDDENEIIASDRASRILKIINSSGWTEDTERGVFSAQYDGHLLHIWEHEEMGWWYQLEDRTASPANNKSEAMRGCAVLVS